MHAMYAQPLTSRIVLNQTQFLCLCARRRDHGVGGIGMCAMKTARMHFLHIISSSDDIQSHRIAQRHLTVVANRAWSF